MYIYIFILLLQTLEQIITKQSIQFIQDIVIIVHLLIVYNLYNKRILV
jgi:hypothetical protein